MPLFFANIRFSFVNIMSNTEEMSWGRSFFFYLVGLPKTTIENMFCFEKHSRLYILYGEDAL